MPKYFSGPNNLRSFSFWTISNFHKCINNNFHFIVVLARYRVSHSIQSFLWNIAHLSHFLTICFSHFPVGVLLHHAIGFVFSSMHFVLGMMYQASSKFDNFFCIDSLDKNIVRFQYEFTTCWLSVFSLSLSRFGEYLMTYYSFRSRIYFPSNSFISLGNFKR